MKIRARLFRLACLLADTAALACVAAPSLAQNYAPPPPNYPPASLPSPAVPPPPQYRPPVYETPNYYPRSYYPSDYYPPTYYRGN